MLAIYNLLQSKRKFSTKEASVNMFPIASKKCFSVFDVCSALKHNYMLDYLQRVIDDALVLDEKYEKKYKNYFSTTKYYAELHKINTDYIQNSEVNKDIATYNACARFAQICICKSELNSWNVMDLIDFYINLFGFECENALEYNDINVSNYLNFYIKNKTCHQIRKLFNKIFRISQHYNSFIEFLYLPDKDVKNQIRQQLKQVKVDVAYEAMKGENGSFKEYQWLYQLNTANNNNNYNHKYLNTSEIIEMASMELNKTEIGKIMLEQLTMTSYYLGVSDETDHLLTNNNNDHINRNCTMSDDNDDEKTAIQKFNQICEAAAAKNIINIPIIVSRNARAVQIGQKFSSFELYCRHPEKFTNKKSIMDMVSGEINSCDVLISSLMSNPDLLSIVNNNNNNNHNETNEPHQVTLLKARKEFLQNHMLPIVPYTVRFNINLPNEDNQKLVSNKTMTAMMRQYQKNKNQKSNEKTDKIDNSTDTVDAKTDGNDCQNETNDEKNSETNDDAKGKNSS